MNWLLAGYSDEIIFQSESIKNVYLTVELLFPDSTAGDWADEARRANQRYFIQTREW